MPIGANEGDIPCIRPYFEINAEGLQTIAGLLASGLVTNNGPHVQHFEKRLAQYLDVPDAVAVSSGADALLLALKGLALPRGKAILPAFTYIATLNAVVHCGLEALFCDIDPGTFTLDPEHLARLMKTHPEVSCVLPVNVFGVPPNLPAIRQLCDGIGAKLVYDNAHGFGTEVDGRRLQREAEVQIFSFHATKTLPAVEGGLIVSENPILASVVRRMRNHGLGPVVSDTVPGFNAKLDEIRAVIGNQSVDAFAETLARRRSYGHRLLATVHRLEDVFTPQVIPKNVNTNFQNLGLRCPLASGIGLARVIELFRAQGIGVRSYFDPPLYKFKGFESGPPLPVTESIWQTLVAIPIHSRMTETVLCRLENALCEVAEALRSMV